MKSEDARQETWVVIDTKSEYGQREKPYPDTGKNCPNLQH
jgi:hypothetical protein